MKLNVSILFLFVMFSCNQKKEVRVQNNTITETSVIVVNEPNEPKVQTLSKTETSLFLLSREEYVTFRDHYRYVSDEEYLGTNYLNMTHLDDSISTGFSDNEGKQGLVDSLRLDMDWLCIRLPQINYGTSFAIHKAQTTAYSLNDGIDFVPLTLLSFQDEVEEYFTCDIAFRGDYAVSDFELSESKELSSDEQIQSIRAIQRTIRDKTTIPPRPMSTDTLLLENIFKIADDITVAKYVVTAYNDSDADYGNEALFVLKNNTLKQWFAGMNCVYNVFELRGIRYLYIVVNTYATSKVTLLKLTDPIEEVYTNLIFGD